MAILFVRLKAHRICVEYYGKKAIHLLPQTLVQLILELKIIWNKFPQVDINHLILWMLKRRIREFVQLQDLITNY